MPSQKLLNQLYALLDLYQQAKISLFRLFISEIQLIFVNLYQHSKNQLFHLLILEIQSVLEPSVFTDTKLAIPIFYYAQPQNFQSHSNLHELVQAYKKSVNSICSFLR